MLIGNSWKIESDSMNVILSKKSRKTNVGKFWKVQGFYSSIKEALHALVDQEIKDTELLVLKTVEEKIEELHTLIDNLAISK